MRAEKAVAVAVTVRLQLEAMKRLACLGRAQRLAARGQGAALLLRAACLVAEGQGAKLLLRAACLVAAAEGAPVGAALEEVQGLWAGRPLGLLLALWVREQVLQG